MGVDGTARTHLALSDVAGLLDGLDPTTLVVALVVAVIVLAGVASRLRRPPTGRRTTRATPQVGKVWWADVPFEDRSGSKDRPCLVVETHGLRAVVLYVTSTDKTGRPGFVPMPRTGRARGAGTSWVRTDRRFVLDAPRFRRFAGPCPPAVRKAVGI